MPSLGIVFELAIPSIRVERGKPRAECRQLFRREALDRTFNVVDTTHTTTLPSDVDPSQIGPSRLIGREST